MERTIIEWIVTQVGLAGIAALSIFITNAVWSDRLASEKARAIEERADKLALLEAYRENSATIKEVSVTLAQHSESIQRLCLALDRIDRRGFSA